MPVVFHAQVSVDFGYVSIGIDQEATFGDTVFPPIVTELDEHDYPAGVRAPGVLVHREGLYLVSTVEAHRPLLTIETHTQEPPEPAAGLAYSGRERVDFLRPALLIGEAFPGTGRWELPWFGPCMMQASAEVLSDGDRSGEYGDVEERWALQFWPTDTSVPRPELAGDANWHER